MERIKFFTLTIIVSLLLFACKDDGINDSIISSDGVTKDISPTEKNKKPKFNGTWLADIKCCTDGTPLNCRLRGPMIEEDVPTLCALDAAILNGTVSVFFADTNKHVYGEIFDFPSAILKDLRDGITSINKVTKNGSTSYYFYYVNHPDSFPDYTVYFLEP